MELILDISNQFSGKDVLIEEILQLLVRNIDT